MLANDVYLFIRVAELCQSASSMAISHSQRTETLLLDDPSSAISNINSYHSCGSTAVVSISLGRLHILTSAA